MNHRAGKLAVTALAMLCAAGAARAQQFHLQEATIADIHNAIRSGQIELDWG